MHPQPEQHYSSRTVHPQPDQHPQPTSTAAVELWHPQPTSTAVAELWHPQPDQHCSSGTAASTARPALQQWNRVQSNSGLPCWRRGGTLYYDLSERARTIPKSAERNGAEPLLKCGCMVCVSVVCMHGVNWLQSHGVGECVGKVSIGCS